jgi:two-component system NtrC family sensor kinase
MRLLTKTQLALIFFAIACFIGVVTSIIVNSLITNQIIFEAQERVKEDLNTARYVYTSKIRDIDRTIRWTSIRHVLKKGLKEKNVSTIRDELAGLMAEEGLDFMTLVDRKGTVIYELSKEGYTLAQKAIIQSIPVPREKPARKIEETSGMVLKSAHPITDFNGEILGALTGGVLLNQNYEIVDRIKNIVFKDAKYKNKEIGTATIFLGDLRISTNVMDREGKRAIGTRASREVYEQVLGKGLPWIHRAFVVDDWYITAYEPIRDVQERIVGMLYVGMLESKYALMKERLILLFFFFSMSGMLIALTISFILSYMMLKTKT